MAESWHRLRIALPGAASDEFAGYCFELGSCGMESAESLDALTHFTVYFESSVDIEALRSRVDAHIERAALAVEAPEWDCEEEEDWTREWRRFFRPVCVGRRYVIHPPWTPVEARAAELPIVIDPGMAFGTGGHESTQLCLQALSRTNVIGADCLDVGCGSCVLTIAALLEGATLVTAIDIDRRAVDNGRDNIASNLARYRDAHGKPCGGSCEVLEGDVGVVTGRTFDFILANLESHIIYPILGALRILLRPGGIVIFSGLLLGERERFEDELATAQFGIEDRIDMNNWLCIVANAATQGD